MATSFPLLDARILLLGAAVTFLILFASSIANYRRLAQFKGPWLGRISSLWIVKATLGGEIHLELQKVNNKYGTNALYSSDF